MKKGIKLDGGEIVSFGQSLREIEELYSCKAVQMNLRCARKGIDMMIKLEHVSLEFDTGRLRGINFIDPYKFTNKPDPYVEEWKNFDAINNKKIYGGMSRIEFLEYLEVWEARAKELGIEIGDFSDLTKNQYMISSERGQFVDMIHISMGPSRNTAGNGRWADGWTLFFVVDSVHKMGDKKPGVLESISCIRDEFNTVARAQKVIIGQ
jgi:hypothetical protein